MGSIPDLHREVVVKDWKFKERLNTEFRAEFLACVSHPRCRVGQLRTRDRLAHEIFNWV
jgi:hypothetical protein